MAVIRRVSEPMESYLGIGASLCLSQAALRRHSARTKTRSSCARALRLGPFAPRFCLSIVLAMRDTSKPVRASSFGSAPYSAVRGPTREPRDEALVHSNGFVARSLQWPLKV